LKVLFLAPYVPWPVRHGGHNRTLGLVRSISGFATVRVLAVGDPAVELAPARDELASCGASLEVHPATGPGAAESDSADVTRLPDAASHFRSPGLLAALLRALDAEPPDVVHLEELVMAQYAPCLSGPAVIDRQKVEWAYHDKMAEREAEAGDRHRSESARFRRWEESLAGAFESVLVTGEGDRTLLDPLHPGRVEVVPLAVADSISCPPDRTDSVDHVLLYGSRDYPPNRDANGTFFREIWPPLRAVAPRLRTVVVGSHPSVPAGVDRRSSPDDRSDVPAHPLVEDRGYVAEIATVLQGPGVLVVPLRVGGGARTRVLEALAAGMPVVSTAVGVDNLGLEPGKHYLRAESPSEFVAAIARLAADRALVRALGRAGVAHVEAGFRWSVLGGRLERIYRAAASAAPGGDRPEPARAPGGLRPGARRALLVGVHPLPADGDLRGLSFPGHRTEQFQAALAAVGCDVECVLLDEENGSAPPGGGRRLLAPGVFRAGRELQRLHDAFAPDVVVAAGGFHAARVAAHLRTDRPRWIDLPGDLAAEGQLRAATADTGALLDYLSVLTRSLAVGDRFSVVGPSHRLALLGQLGLAGRLVGEVIGREPVCVVPLACRGPAAPPELPAEGFRALWAGGYNTWMDAETLMGGLEAAMARHPGLAFVSMGGAVPGHAEDVHRRFWERARASPYARRFQDCGRLPRRNALDLVASCHIVLCVSRRSLEAELGARQRVVEAFAHGRPAVVTALGDLARDVAESDSGPLVPPGEPEAVAAALVRLAEDRGTLVRMGRRARALWERRWTYEASTPALSAWAAVPERWPAPVLGDGSVLHEERVRLQAELDEIRSSHTFRALRLLDRMLGRGRPAR